MTLDFKILIALNLFLLTACGTFGVQTTKPEDLPLWNYRADMQAQIGSTRFDGTGTAKLAGPLDVTFLSPTKMDRLQITTCAREEVINNAGQSYVYNYVPSPKELEGSCPLYAEAFSKESLTSWFFLGFKTTEDLPSHVFCNGYGWKFSGMTVCQSKAGLIQTLEFANGVDSYRAEDSCHAVTTDNKNFTVTPDKGFCRMTFAKKDDKGIHWHRAIFIGYKGVLVR